MMEVGPYETSRRPPPKSYVAPAFLGHKRLVPNQALEVESPEREHASSGDPVACPEYDDPRGEGRSLQGQGTLLPCLALEGLPRESPLPPDGLPRLLEPGLGTRVVSRPQLALGHQSEVGEGGVRPHVPCAPLGDLEPPFAVAGFQLGVPWPHEGRPPPSTDLVSS